MSRPARILRRSVWLAALGVLLVSAPRLISVSGAGATQGASPAPAPQSAGRREVPASQRTAADARVPSVPPAAAATIQTYCVTCHNDRLKTGGLVLDPATLADVSADG